MLDLLLECILDVLILNKSETSSRLHVKGLFYLLTKRKFATKSPLFAQTKMPTAAQYEQYQSLRMTAGFLFVIMWIQYLCVYHFDATISSEYRDRLRLKVVAVWIWNIFDFCSRKYLMKTSAPDIAIHHVLMIVILPLVWYHGLALNLCLFCTLFHESIIIYFAAYRLHQFYRKPMSWTMHWVGSIITFIRLCITLNAAYHHIRNTITIYDLEWILGAILILSNLLFHQSFPMFFRVRKKLSRIR